MNSAHEALLEFKNVAQIDPENADAFYRLALTYLKLGWTANRQEDFSDAEKRGQQLLGEQIVWRSVRNEMYDGLEMRVIGHDCLALRRPRGDRVRHIGWIPQVAKGARMQSPLDA